MMHTMMWKWEGKLMRGDFNGECPLEVCLGMIMGMMTMLLVDILMTMMEDSMGMADMADMMKVTVDTGEGLTVDTEDTMADMMDTMGMAGTMMDAAGTVGGTMTDTEEDTEEDTAEDMAEDLEAMGFTRHLEKL